MADIVLFPVSRSRPAIEKAATFISAEDDAGWHAWSRTEAAQFLDRGISDDEVCDEFNRLGHAAAEIVERRIRTRAKATIRREERLRLVQADQLSFDFDAAPATAPLVDGQGGWMMGLVHTDDVELGRIVAVIERQAPTQLGGTWSRIVRKHQRDLRALGVSEGDASEEGAWLFYEVWTRSPAMRERMPTPAFVRRVREGMTRAEWEGAKWAKLRHPSQAPESYRGQTIEAPMGGSFSGPDDEPRVGGSAGTAQIPRSQNPGSGSENANGAGG